MDYSQTINQYTELDAYPLPRSRIERLCINLKSAYQVSIQESDRKFTRFEANGRLYQFCRIPFGLANGVVVFQRAMDRMVEEEALKDTFPYLDNITVAGRHQQEHDANVKKFLEAVEQRNLTLNKNKSVENKTSINIFGYYVCSGLIKPDEERLKPLQEFPPSTNVHSLRRIVGMFAYYGYQTF